MSLVCNPERQILWKICCIKTLVGHRDSVQSLVVLLNGVLASSSVDNRIKLWSTDTQTCLHTLTGDTDWIMSLAVLPNGFLASGSLDSRIKLWSTDTQTCLHSLIGHADADFEEKRG